MYFFFAENYLAIERNLLLRFFNVFVIYCCIF